MIRFIDASVVLFSILGVGVSAWADSEQDDVDAQARELFYHGERHYEAGRYDRAAVLYEGAYELSDRPAILFAIANSHDKLGNHGKSASYLRSYIKLARPRNEAGLWDRVVSLEARADKIRLEKRNRQLALEEERIQERLADFPRTNQEADTRKQVGYLAVTVGGLGVAGAVAFGLASKKAGSQAAELCQNGLCPGSARTPITRKRRFALAADISAGVGIVSGVVGVYLLVKGKGDKKEERSSFSVTPSLYGNGGGVEVRAEF